MPSPRRQPRPVETSRAEERENRVDSAEVHRAVKTLLRRLVWYWLHTWM